MSDVITPLFDVDAVLFDLDGTLVDSAPDLAAAANALRAARQLPPLPVERYRPHASSGARGMLHVALDMAPDHPDYEPQRQAFFTQYQACLAERTQPFDGIPQLLGELLTRRIAWGVVTNKAERFTTPLTDALDIFASAQIIVSGDTTPHAKPHPAPLLYAAEGMGLAPERCLYVGDDLRDIQAAQAANMPSVAVAYGYLGHGIDVNAWGADAIIATPLDLLKHLHT
ncbi:MAG: phosphoglycolate phosphatase [Burkholderiales bacterium]|nr:phosphoglycolate phosphatase [Burkholderiales bacterium]